MVLLAVLLVGAMLFLEVPAQRLADRVDEEGPEAAEGPEQKDFIRLYGYYWIGFLLLLLFLVVLAGIDLWAVRRFGLRQLRRLPDHRRAIIAPPKTLMRQRRRHPELPRRPGQGCPPTPRFSARVPWRRFRGVLPSQTACGCSPPRRGTQRRPCGGCPRWR